ncbi:MAG: recombinase family protein [Oscillospiraceae bacterium]|nr:recombinase family protein [Oscillospiraceae bacterium]
MVGLYIRLSRLDDDLDEYKQVSNSVENQRRLLNEYLEELPDLRGEDVEEFIDDGYSGTNFQRPAFQRMLALIKKRVVTTVIVKDFSRFGRNYVECADYLEKLFPFLGTRFISVSDNYDSGKQNEDRQIEVAMKNIVNSYYSQDLSRKVTTTFDMKRERGEIFFNVPFGYVKDMKHKGKVLIDEEAAEIVRLVFSLACDGKQVSEIAKILNKENIPTIASYNERNKMRGKMVSPEKSEYAAWTGTKVRNILLNEFYTGTYISQRRKQVIAGMKKTVEVRNPVKIPNNHPAIISVETFEKAQEIFKSRQSKYAVGRRYPLKSKVFCGNCGYAMAYRDNVYDECYFYCNHTMETGNNDGCSDERIMEEFLGARVLTQLKSWMMLLEVACGNVDEAEQKRWEGIRILSDEAENLQAEFKTLQSKKLELYESYSDGQISKEEFSTQKEKLSAEIDSIRVELNKLHEKEAKLRKTRNRRKPELDDLMESVRLFENENRLTCKMADTFIEKVTVYDKWCIEITWKCEDLVEKALSDVAEAEKVVSEVGVEKMVG